MNICEHGLKYSFRFVLSLYLHGGRDTEKVLTPMINESRQRRNNRSIGKDSRVGSKRGGGLVAPHLVLFPS